MKIYNPLEINREKIYVAFKSTKDAFWMRKEYDPEVLSPEDVLVCRSFSGHGWHFAYESNLEEAIAKEVYDFLKQGYVIYICDTLEEFRELKLKFNMLEGFIK